MQKIILTILWLGESTNFYKGKHWSFYNKHKKAALIALAEALRAQYPKQDITIAPPVKITLRAFTGKGANPYDLVNYSTSYKMLEDSAVNLGIIPDDTAKIVTAFEIESPCAFKTWHKPDLPTMSHIVLEIKSVNP